ncbi:succinylglutamate desuccinylase/aspartoacylase family protein [Winogradskyella sp.]|nr:succinylglutamate desuccinylase/aspartoacylase family protein [Winogradskyella sp.]MDA8874140.1 succinylglutamate desuccinylase/aspartoacylase family protein [Winogradskyella sp.]
MNELLKDSIFENRIIYHIKGKQKGPTPVFFAGIHGNEQAGVNALKSALPQIDKQTVCGEIYGIYGNINALEQNKRYIDDDLNRIWTTKHINQLSFKKNYSSEEREQIAIYKFISGILKKNKEPLYFIDFHTTSSKTLPFITINDALINRKFSKHFPVPIVLGIEEYLEGPLLSYLNKKGYVSLGFESGQHNDKKAIKNCESFIYLSCHISGLLTLKSNVFNKHYQRLELASKNKANIYEVIYKYGIRESEDFKMKKGFQSFQLIKKGTLLATSNSTPIYSQYSNELFMSLYQKAGNDGFFIIKRTPLFF